MRTGVWGMPVLECSCGMVMSVSVATPRNTCIRCGGAAFRELERFKSLMGAAEYVPLVAIASCGSRLPMPALASTGEAVDPRDVGGSISAHMKFW